MGCSASKPIIHPHDDHQLGQVTQKVEWRLLPSHEEARARFEADGTLTKNSIPGHLELRTMLDDSLAQPAIFKYAKETIKSQEPFMCWIDIQEFKSIPSNDYRRSKALHIYHKYIKIDAILCVGDIDMSERNNIKADLDRSKDNPEIITMNFYDKIQAKCFLSIYHNIFLLFKQTNEYTDLILKLSQLFNHVKLSDFEYFGKLGEGGFGFVVHCRKISTNKHYAMKLQTKKGLLECFSDDPQRADFEKQAFASCQHPFIVNLDYAFQTPSLAIMVLGLATSGDLQKALNKAPGERLPEDRVRFYVAEIVLALQYLHQMGLMYRDLKPNNVLLNEDGHIQLVDLGGVVDEYGTILGNDTDHNISPLFTKKYNKQPLVYNHSLSGIREEGPEGTQVDDPITPSKPKRKLSIMGTFGYMAPEMVIMLSQASYEKTGYTYAVDWWSLGVTMFKLLTGYRPFTDDNFNTFVEMATTMNALVKEHCDSSEYAILFQEINYPNYISDQARNFMSKLLDVNPKTRLGSGPNGAKNIKSHPFFHGIDWELLEQKHIEPPFKPEPTKSLDNLQSYPDLETLLREYGKADWLEDEPSKEDQKYFLNWNFTSPQTVRIESGLSHVMEQYDRNFKVKQLLGMDAKEYSNNNNSSSVSSTQSGKKITTPSSKR